MVEELRQEKPSFGIWSSNVPIVNAFLTVASQWRLMPLGTGGAYWQGLDYAAAKAGLELAQMVLTPEQWSGVQLMEDAARSILNGYRG